MRLTERQARLKLQRAIQAAGTAAALARSLGVSPVLVSDALHGRRAISGKIAAYLGLRQVRRQTISYIKESQP